MKIVFFLFLITVVSIFWNKRSNAFQLKRISRDNYSPSTTQDRYGYSFLKNTVAADDEDGNVTDKNEKTSETKQEEGNEQVHEKRGEETNETKPKTNEETNALLNHTDVSPILGTHDSQGKFIPSYQLLSNEILSANNALERSSQFLKVACSHILKILEFIPEDKVESYYVKLDSKNIYIKELGDECHKLYFSIEKLSMSVIVLNSKLHKLIFSPPSNKK